MGLRAFLKVGWPPAPKKKRKKRGGADVLWFRLKVGALQNLPVGPPQFGAFRFWLFLFVWLFFLGWTPFVLKPTVMNTFKARHPEDKVVDFDGLPPVEFISFGKEGEAVS